MADMTESDESAQAAGAAQAPGLLTRVKLAWANPAYRFVMLFLPFLVIVAVAYPELVRRHNPIIQSFILWTAKIEYWIFSLVSETTTLNKKLVVFDGFAVSIIDECTGIYEMLIFSAAVLAFPTSWKKKAVGLLLGNPAIYVFNVVRIAMLIVVGRYWPGAFDFMHLYFWQATMIAMIVSVWLLWIIKVVRTDEAPLPATA